MAGATGKDKSKLEASQCSPTTPLAEPPIKPHLTDDNLKLTPPQLTRHMSEQTGVMYRAIFVHCLLFNENDEALLVRHADPLHPKHNPGEFHDAGQWCSPAVTCERYGFEEDTPELLERIDELTVAEWFRCCLPSYVYKNTTTLLCAMEATMTYVLPADGSVDGEDDNAEQGPRPNSEEGEEKRYPALVLAIGARKIAGDPMWLTPAACQETYWVKREQAEDWKGGCTACCRRDVFAEAVKQWQKRKIAFGERDGAWMGRRQTT